MTTPEGTITMLDVIEELDGTPTPRLITLNDADVRGLAEVPAGQISMDDLRGKSARTILVTGDILVGEYNPPSTYGVPAGAGGGFPDGALSNIVIDPAFTNVTYLNQLLTQPANGTPQNSVQVGTNPITDKSGTFLYVTVNNGVREVTTELVSWAHSSLIGTTLGRSAENAPVVLFSAADVGTTYSFEVWR